MNRHKKYVRDFIIISFLIIISIEVILRYEDISVKSYVFFILFFILNIQIRLNFASQKKFQKLVLFSVFIDLLLIYFINNQFKGITFLLLTISLFDSLSFLGIESRPVLVIIFGFLFYLIKDKSITEILLSFLWMFNIIIFVSYLKKTDKKINDLQRLYDENRRYSYELESTKKRLEIYSRKIEFMSQLQERNRISREIHDTIGHKLTGVFMQTQAALKVVEMDKEKGIKMLYSVIKNMKQCIDILRQTVRSMKPKGYNNRILSIKQMINDFSKNTGTNIEFEIIGTPVKLSPGIEITIYKNTQEAMTNAVNHGAAKNIDVKLIYNVSQLILIIKDDGKGNKDIIKGMGISGMEERVNLLGGRINICSDNGFEIKSTIPINDY